MSDYYVARDDLNYYNSKKNFKNVFEFLTHIITFLNFIYQCRRCRKIFDFNNLLHTYLKKIHQIVRKDLHLYLLKSFANDDFSLLICFDFIRALLLIIEAYSTITSRAIKSFILKSKLFKNEKSFLDEKFFANIKSKLFTNEKSFLNEKSFVFINNCFVIILFIIDVFQKIETKYAYRRYSHVKEKMTLSQEFCFNDICYDIDVNIICANWI